MSSLQQYEVVPATPLVTSEVLREETDQWTDVKQGLSLALQEMRVDQVREVKSFTKNYCDVYNHSIVWLFFLQKGKVCLWLHLYEALCH